MLFTESPKSERRWGLKVAVVATVVATASLSFMAANKRSDAKKLSGELLAKATLPQPTNIAAPDDAEVQIFKLTIHPGGSGGWHSHSGTVLVNVTHGTASFYEARGDSCIKKSVEKGKSIVEQPGVIHETRNEGKRDLVIHGVSIRPKGTQPGTWQLRPSNCHQ
jgi:quercetin dioxygenase-like cupin family protein